MAKKKNDKGSDGPNWATVDEMRTASENLSSADSLRIEKYARARVRVIRLYTEAYTHLDLIREAYTRMIAGKRNWDKSKVPFVKFFIGIIHSISGHIIRDFHDLTPERGRMTEDGEFTDPMDDLPALGSDPATIAEAEQKALRFLEPFEGNEDVWNYIQSRDAGFTQKETEICCDMTPQRYDAARKKVERAVQKYESE